jgi:hypothetical protein
VHLILAEPVPCDGCRYAQRCSTERLACSAFALFASGADATRWQFAPRVPTGVIYEMTMVADKRSRTDSGAVGR